MKTIGTSGIGLLLLALALDPRALSAAASDKPIDLNTPRTFPDIETRAEWEQRARNIREQVLVSCGLWPMPERGPVNSRIFGRIERDGYSVEKVWVETYPGFYLAGNLYRPLGKGRGPFPGILNPHGHWTEGRLTDTQDGSAPARCISFARQGMVAFTYDMVGYNDTRFADTPATEPNYKRHRFFGTNNTDQLWSISLMGLQTWNSLRALDFLASLPDVDKKRLACTGESGGGTQTFMLGAIDDRLAAQAPIVMVSHSMQGGCSCENVFGLRVDYSNMEISAAAAPRPQLLVAATGDWTRATLTVEGPSIARMYELLGARDRFHYVLFDYGHNYNKTTREAVYEFFGRWLLRHPDPSALKEEPYHKEPDNDLRVFPEGTLPDNAITQAQLIEALKSRHRAQWQALVPRNKGDLKRFKSDLLPAWQRTLQVHWPMPTGQVRLAKIQTTDRLTSAEVTISSPGAQDSISATYVAPERIVRETAPRLVVLSTSEDTSAIDVPARSALISTLLQRGLAVLVINRFSTGEPADQFANFYATYNRTKLQSRVRDLLTICSSAPSLDPRRSLNFRVILAGSGHAGLWSLLAAPAAHAVAADYAQLDATDEHALLGKDLFCPGLLRIGGFQGAGMLSAPQPLLLHNTGTKFSTVDLRAAYAAGRAADRLRIEGAKLDTKDLVSWIVGCP